MRLPEPPGPAGPSGPAGPGDLNGYGGFDGHDDLRMAVGALALEALDDEEARLVRAHLAGCPECEAEYQSFVGVRGVLDVALVGGIPRAERYQAHAERDPERGASVRTPARVVGRKQKNSGVAVAPRRRKLTIALSSVAAALVIAASGLTGALIGSSGGAPASVAQSTHGSGPVVQLASAANSFGVSASIRYQQVNWGTWVSITMTNVPADYSCSLLAYDKQGREYPVSSWRSAEGQKTVTAPGGVALSPNEIDHFEVDMGPQEWSLSIPMTS